MAPHPQRQEKDDDYVVMLDPETGKAALITTMANSTKTENAENPVVDGFLREENEPLVRMNVTKPYAGFGKEGVGLRCDSRPDPGEIKKVVRAFVQFSCLIENSFQKGSNVLVNCQEGRSRSPNVMMAHIITFRGKPLDKVQEWFKKAFRSQRPKTSKVSPNFPNCDTFFPVLEFLVRASENKEGHEHQFVKGALANKLPSVLVRLHHISSIPFCFCCLFVGIVEFCEGKLDTKLVSKLFPPVTTCSMEKLPRFTREEQWGTSIPPWVSATKEQAESVSTSEQIQAGQEISRKSKRRRTVGVTSTGN